MGWYHGRWYLVGFMCWYHERRGWVGITEVGVRLASWPLGLDRCHVFVSWVGIMG